MNRVFEGLGQDFRYGVRVLRLNSGFAATAILSLALGVAANTSIFTLTDQILLRLLPVQSPRELVQFRMEGGRVGSQNGDGLHDTRLRETVGGQVLYFNIFKMLKHKT